MKKWILRIVIAMISVIVILLVIGFLSLNTLVKKGVETVGPMVTKTDVKLEAADISPFSGSGRLIKLVVGNPPGYSSPSCISVGDAKLAVEVASLMSGNVITINDLSVSNAELTLEGSLNGNNLSTILDNVKGGGTNTVKTTNGTATDNSKTAKKFIVKHLLIAGTKLNANLDLPVIGRKTMSLTLPDLEQSNIGTTENGVTVEELTEDIIKPLLESAKTQVVKIAGNVSDELKNNVTSQLKNLSQGTNQMSNAVDSVSSFFKKKK